MNRTTTITTLSALALVAAAGGGLLFAGPLDPPAGPVAPTYKTLAEVEPRTAINATNTPGDADSVFKITLPGSFYLAGNLAGGVSGKAGIEIAASNVTLDLAGFTIDGSITIGLPASLDGIRATGSIRAVTIKNGTVRDFGGDGLDLGGVTGLVVTDLTVDSCVGHGLLPGPFSRVERCLSLGHGGHGFHISAPGVIVRDCTAAQNDADGIYVVGIAARVERCTAESNALHGIQVLSQAVIEDNICAFNGLGAGVTDGAGIKVSGTGARIARNHTTSNDYGIWAVNDSNVVYQNWASQNSTSNFETFSTHGFGVSRNTADPGLFLSEVTPYRNFEFAP